jgi:hypothetical protein
MATTIKLFGRAVLSTGSTTLYTVPASTTAVVTNIVLTNINPTTARTANVLLSDIPILYLVTVPAASAAMFDVKQAIPAAGTIKALASAGTDIQCHISGIEVA